MKNSHFVLFSFVIGVTVDAARIQVPDAALTSTSYRKPPLWPQSYSVSYNYSLPLAKPEPVSYPVTVHRDFDKQAARVEVFENVVLAKHHLVKSLIPQIDTLHCIVFHDDYDDESMDALPDLTDWEFNGVDGNGHQKWTYINHRQGKTISYEFLADESGHPKRLDIIGQDFISKSHFDHYAYEYTSYSPGKPDEEAFKTPEACKGVKPEPESLQKGKAHLLRLKSLLPKVQYSGDGAYDNFLASEHGQSRRHSSLREYTMRQEIFQSNLQLIERHNAANVGYTLAINKFADWTREEYLAVMLPNHSKPREGRNEIPKKYELKYEPLADPNKLPTSIDWRKSGADGIGFPKDQAACGSCWVFGATAAMEAAWFMRTGDAVSFSEQQIMDCSWGYVPEHLVANQACDGGDPWAAIGWTVENGGVSLSKDYRYQGQDRFCRKDAPVNGTQHFKGFVRTPMGDEKALKESLFSRGPLSVSIDASQPSFTFYSSGVYYDPNCKYMPDDLDHAVTLVGYGHNEEEGSYYVIRNSWSEAWGDKGYIRISTDSNACGVAYDATYALLD